MRSLNKRSGRSCNERKQKRLALGVKSGPQLMLWCEEKLVSFYLLLLFFWKSSQELLNRFGPVISEIWNLPWSRIEVKSKWSWLGHNDMKTFRFEIGDEIRIWWLHPKNAPWEFDPRIKMQILRKCVMRTVFLVFGITRFDLTRLSFALAHIAQIASKI